MHSPAERWRWLGAPWFLVAVAALAINDHLLKDAYPGWWTGKASDVAGLAVVAVLAAVVVGVPRGVALAAVGFVALKTVPGVAEVAAPVLGGRTLRDATDLLALVVLIPVGWALHRSARVGSSNPRTMPDVWARRPVPAQAARGAVVLPIIGAVVAMFATTATSCSPRPAVDRLVVEDGIVYADVTRGYGEQRWARTDDGGRTWVAVDLGPEGARPSADDPSEDDPAGPLRACGADGTCFRLRDQRVIEVTSPGGETTDEFVLTSEQFDAISTGCAGAQRGVLASVAAPTDGGPAMASLGAGGVVVRQADGGWERVAVLGAHPPPPDPPGVLGFGTLVFGPVLAGAIWLLARKRWPSWRAAIGVALGGWGGSIVLSGAVEFLSDPDRHLGIAFVLPLGCVLTLVAAIVVGRNPRFAPQKPQQADPPLPPPDVPFPRLT